MEVLDSVAEAEGWAYHLSGLVLGGQGNVTGRTMVNLSQLTD